MALSMNGPNFMDPRSTVGMLARGSNTYMGASKSPHAGQPTQALNSAPLVPQYKKSSLQDVAKAFLNGNSK